jgi:uncharacterized membrane protein YgcG
MGEQLSTIASKRSAEKERLRAALAGDEEAAVAGDRVAVADRGAVIESEDKSPSGDGPASSADGSSAAGSSTGGSSTGGSGASGSSTEAELPADARAEPAAEEKK